MEVTNSAITDDPHNQSVNRMFEMIMFGDGQEVEGKVGFTNFGFWKNDDDNLEIANIRLIELLIGFFTKTEGTVLDVACGMGASTKYLTNYFDPSLILGTNISPQQLQVCRVIAPKCKFELMEATSLTVADSSYDNILCIEAALYFLTRKKFLQEAFRVLSAGGRLAMSDLLFPPDGGFYGDVHPRENHVSDTNEYRNQLIEIGFRYVRVEDISDRTIHAKLKFLRTFLEKKRGSSKLEILDWMHWKARMPLWRCYSVFAMK